MFNEIPSARKSYQKILDHNSPDYEQSMTKDGRREYFQQADGALRGKIAEDEKIAMQENEFHFAGETESKSDDEVQEAATKDDTAFGEFKQKKAYERNASEQNNSSYDEHQHF